MAAASNITSYLFRIGDDNHIYCDQNKLEYHLIHMLRYNKHYAQGILRLFDGGVDAKSFAAYLLARIPIEVKESILQSLEHEQLLRLLCCTDKHRKTALHWCAENRSLDVGGLILESVSEDELFQLLRITDSLGHTPLYEACKSGNQKLVRMMLQKINQDMRYSLLKMADSWGHSSLHRAAYRGNQEHIDILNLIHESVSEIQWSSLLQIKDRQGRTVTQVAAYWNNQNTITRIRDAVSNDTWLQLLTTPLPEFDPYEHYKNLFQQAVYLIDKYRPAAKIRKALDAADRQDQELQIKSITETESLSLKQIEELSPHSPHYVIPHKQEKSKRYGLILFSSENRSGAAAEADDHTRGMEAAGCSVKKMEWSDAIELHTMIDSALDEITADCSLLMVCLMAHGSRGVVQGGAGKAVPVNDILHQFGYRLPKYVPLVFLVQACQTPDRIQGVLSMSRQDPAPTQLSDPQSDKHITLTRPHTVLLLATVRGGVAYRGIFTGAMANQFRCSDGKTDIYTMFNRAVCEMKRNNPPAVAHQNPKFEAVTDKMLFIPPATSNT